MAAAAPQASNYHPSVCSHPKSEEDEGDDKELEVCFKPTVCLSLTLPPMFLLMGANSAEAVGVGRAGKHQTPLSLRQDDGGQLSESTASPCQYLYHGGENSEDVTFQHPTTPSMCAAAQKEPLHDAKTLPAIGHTPPQEPAVSRVPLRVTARCLQRFFFCH